MLVVLGFAAGLGLSAWFGADAGRRASLMFGLGMTNNGTGLVLATSRNDISFSDGGPRVWFVVLQRTG
jgi:predicted Na+-dependent transporter